MITILNDTDNESERFLMLAERLGNGTVVYALSRDNGATWSPVMTVYCQF